MEGNIERSAGTALIVGSLLMIFTMALHPVGGSFAHLLNVSVLIIITHSIALLAIPLVAFGLLGLSLRLKKEMVLSILAFIIIVFGLFAVLCAAALNGLALPLFIAGYKDAGQPAVDSILPFLKYNSTLNHAFDFIFIIAICISVILWSIAILRTKMLPKWLGYYGVLLAAFAIVLLAAGFVFVSLYGFRLFIFGIVTWIIGAGYLLHKKTD